ncbi:MAG: hypothetical protein JNJ77_15575 [Planctomycetia bacterium]|nr:hypothetical protein [Planctomycetia bacterium]
MKADEQNPEPVAEQTPALPRHLQFDAVPFRPDGGFSGPGLIMLMLGLMGAGIALGALVHFIGQWIYLVILFPIIIGCILGGLGAQLIKTGKVRSPFMAGLAGLFAGILCFLTQQYLDYRQFLEQRDVNRLEFQAMLQDNPVLKQLKNLKLNNDLNLAVLAMKVESFPEYINFRATQGIKVKKLNLGYYGTYAYWMVELLIITGIVFSMVRATARQPFCPLTYSWKTERCGTNFQIPTELGTDAIIAALREGALGKISEVKCRADLLSTENMIPVRLYVYASPQHAEPCTLDVRLVSVHAKQDQTEEKELAMVTYPAVALASLEALCH